MALLSALARRLGRTRMGALSRVSRLPLSEGPGPSRLSMMAPHTMDSSIDPRLIIGGGALAMAPMSTLMAKALREYEPWEDQFGRENEWYRDAEMKNQELRDMLEFWKEGY